MKRDMDLPRALMLKLEALPSGCRSATQAINDLRGAGVRGIMGDARNSVEIGLTANK